MRRWQYECKVKGHTSGMVLAKTREEALEEARMEVEELDDLQVMGDISVFEENDDGTLEDE